MINEQIEQLAQMCQREFTRLHERIDATKEDLQRMATKEDLQKMASKEDLLALATKADLEVFRVEMRERFESVSDRLDRLERAYEMQLEQISKLSSEILALRQDIDRVEKNLIYLSDDMRQRFRLVSDRLAALEKRLAA